jgi:hypothetical protein
MTTIKAVRATITLGDIELDVFQLPDGGYYFTQSVLKTIHITLSNTSGKKYVKPILEANSALLQTAQLDGNPVKLKLIPMTLFGEIVGIYAKLGNEFCIAILVACFEESLERRADTAFDVKRTEEEYNARLAQRTKGYVARRTLTDSIRDYTIKHESSETYIKFIYSNCSDHLNKIILGAKAKQAKEFYALPAHSLLRNHIPVKALRELELVEEMASRLIDERDIEPLEAVKQACIICFTKTVGLE